MKSKIYNNLFLLSAVACLYFIFTMGLSMDNDQSIQAHTKKLKEFDSSQNTGEKTYEVIWNTDEAPTLFKTDKLKKAIGYIVTYRENHEMYLRINTSGMVAYVSVDQINQLDTER